MRAFATGAVLLLVAAACSSSGQHGGSAFPGSASDFSATVDNPWFPLEPGTTFVYRGAKDGKDAEDRVTVTRRTKEIDGVEATAVRDLLYLDGKLAERTTDWYAQDARGNVWYFGEATAELDRRGHVTSTEGSWQAGVDGARAGVFMPARPRVGQVYRQEYYKGHAEDHFRVVSMNENVRTPYAGSKFGVLTREWTPLEPDVLDFKVYIRGVGNVKERSSDGSERMALVSVYRS